ncbi:MAG TPA: hypothetical protein VFG31_09610 [Conexibacter sp.]|nr:hypothetical protein [Conexibacter sp.]
MPGPGAAFWLAGLVIALGGLGADLVAAANRGGGAPGGWLERALQALRDSSLALSIIACVGLIGAVYCMRRLLLRRLAWKPGPIEVPDFVTERDAEAPVALLSMLFRERLAAVHLTAPDAFPTAPESQDFLQLLTSAAKPGDLLGTIAGLLASMLPKSAYRVSGTLLRQPGREPFGVVVQVVTAPRHASPPLFFWDVSWEAAVERAAYAVASYLLPRTTDCLKPPWTRWRGIELPDGLVARGTRASEAASACRYDEALAAYFAAIELDPRNLELRFEVGLLQEKLALWLDAYATYNELTMLAARTPRRPRLRRRERRVRRAEARIALLARYRKAILASYGQRLAEQWGRHEMDADNALRGAERRALVQRLRSVFEGDLRRLKRKLLGPEDKKTWWSLRKPTRPSIEHLERILRCDDGLPVKDEVRLGELFARISQRDLKRLARTLIRPRSRRNAAGLTRRSALVAADLAGLRGQFIRVLLQKQTKLPPVKQIDRSVRWRMRPWARSDWQTSYNAACTYALALVPDTDCVRAACGPGGQIEYKPEDREQLARHALERLDQALSQLDSSGLARRRAWIVGEDPDLDELRKWLGFAEIEARYFPSARAVPPRPRDLQRLEIVRYAARLLQFAAYALSDAWREREAEWSDNGGPGDACLFRWLDEEDIAVEHFMRTATEHRHWQTRASALRALRRWALAHERTLDPIGYVDYSADPVEPVDSERLDDAAERVRGELARAMCAVERAHVIVEGEEVEHHTAWLRAVKDVARDLDGVVLCRQRAQWWEWLGDTLPVKGEATKRCAPELTGPYERGQVHRAHPDDGALTPLP